MIDSPISICSVCKKIWEDLRGSERISEDLTDEYARRVVQKDQNDLECQAVSGCQLGLPNVMIARHLDRSRSRNLMKLDETSSLGLFTEVCAFWLNVIALPSGSVILTCLLTWGPGGKGRTLAWQGAWHENTMMPRGDWATAKLLVNQPPGLEGGE